MQLAEIRAEVNRRADAALPAVVDELFSRVKREHVHHNGLFGIGCACDYCATLHRYVTTKIAAQRQRRREEGSIWNEPLPPAQDLPSVALFSQAAQLRAHKNHLLSLSQ